MSGDTKIEWADKVWNPVTGCTKVSDGCENCYAERMSKRLAGRCGYPADDPFKVTLHPGRLDEPPRWKKPQRVFVCSMGDLFHEDVPFEFINKVWTVMLVSIQHTFLVLTKRPDRMWQFFSEKHQPYSKCDGPDKPIPNVHLGVSVEDQKTADERIPLLLQTPAAKRFVSYEPALGPVDMRRFLPAKWECSKCGYRTNKSVGSCRGYRCSQNNKGALCDAMPCPICEKRHYWSGSMASIDGVIMGGESGPGARPMHLDWARSVRDQCKAAGVAFFFKQWGAYAPAVLDAGPDDEEPWRVDPEGNRSWQFDEFSRPRSEWPEVEMRHVGKKGVRPLLDGKEHKEQPA